jgi:hypothetical protein
MSGAGVGLSRDAVNAGNDEWPRKGAKNAKKVGEKIEALVLPSKSNVSAPDTTTIYPFFCAFCAFLRLFLFEHPLARSIA